MPPDHSILLLSNLIKHGGVRISEASMFSLPGRFFAAVKAAASIKFSEFFEEVLTVSDIFSMIRFCKCPDKFHMLFSLQ